MKLYFTMLLLLCALPVAAQQIAVSPANKTIAVTVDERIGMDPDVALVQVAYHNYGTTEAEAYKANLEVSERVIQALLRAGIDRRLIETAAFTLERVDAESAWTPEQKKTRLFEATQSWEIRLVAKGAQAVVDLAMRAGANKLKDVRWDVADRSLLQAKAGAAALAKARRIAEQMAQGLNSKLGDLVYASNRAPATFVQQYLEATMPYSVNEGVAGGGGGAYDPSLFLFPQKVEETATVHAVFAIQ